MSTRIISQDAFVRQAIAEYQARYPRQSQENSAHLAVARRIVRAGGVIRDDKLGGFLVGTRSKKTVLLVREDECACRQPVCTHRLAVCIAKRAMELEHAAEQECAAIFAEEDVDDAHAEHGDWVGCSWHTCMDGIERPVPPNEEGELPTCLHCGQAYCAACDRAVMMELKR